MRGGYTEQMHRPLVAFCMVMATYTPSLYQVVDEAKVQFEREIDRLRTLYRHFPPEGQYYELIASVEPSPVFVVGGVQRAAAGASPDSRTAQSATHARRYIADTKSERFRLWVGTRGTRMCSELDRTGDATIVRDVAISDSTVWMRTEQNARIQRSGAERPGMSDRSSLHSRASELLGRAYFFGLDLVLRDEHATLERFAANGENWTAVYSTKGDIGASRITVEGRMASRGVQLTKVISDSTAGLSSGCIYQYAFPSVDVDSANRPYAPVVVWDDSWRGSRKTIRLRPPTRVDDSTIAGLLEPPSFTVGDAVRGEPPGFWITDYREGDGVEYRRTGGAPLLPGGAAPSAAVSRVDLNDSPQQVALRRSNYAGWIVLAAATTLVGVFAWRKRSSGSP